MNDDFQQANKAFDLFTLQERTLALEEFAQLQYPSVRDRFFEAVHRVIKAQQCHEEPQSDGAVDPHAGSTGKPSTRVKDL